MRQVLSHFDDTDKDLDAIGVVDPLIDGSAAGSFENGEVTRRKFPAL